MAKSQKCLRLVVALVNVNPGRLPLRFAILKELLSLLQRNCNGQPQSRRFMGDRMK